MLHLYAVLLLRRQGARRAETPLCQDRDALAPPACELPLLVRHRSGHVPHAGVVNGPLRLHVLLGFAGLFPDTVLPMLGEVVATKARGW